MPLSATSRPKALISDFPIRLKAETAAGQGSMVII